MARSCGSEERWTRVSELGGAPSEGVEVRDSVERDESVTRCCVSSSSSMTVHCTTTTFLFSLWLFHHEFSFSRWLFLWLIDWYLMESGLWKKERKEGRKKATCVVVCRGICVFGCYWLLVLCFSLFQVGCRVLPRLRNGGCLCTVSPLLLLDLHRRCFSSNRISRFC